METGLSNKDSSWFFYTFPALLGSSTLNLADGWVLFSIFAAIVSVAAISWWFAAGGTAWKNGRNAKGSVPIPGPRGLPVLGSLFTLSHGKLAHRALAAMAERLGAKSLMAFSIGSTPAVVASDPHTAREILTSVHFADRPVKQSARLLMFERAIGFAPNGTYWRLLRRIASTHLFAPKRIAAHEPGRLLDASVMLAGISAEQAANGSIAIRRHLQGAALNNIMGSVFGKRYDVASDGPEVAELREMVGEGFELLGAFNWSDFLPLLNWVYDPIRIRARCGSLVPRVRSLVKGIIDEHKGRRHGGRVDHVGDYNADFVDVLLSLQGEEQLQEDDMIAVLWEMIFRGTDTTALLTEWTVAELVLNPDVQSKVRAELERVVGRERTVQDADIARLPYLQAVVKESLRVHPPGPLLSWARLATEDVHLSNGMVVPAGTTAMVNMWSITHDPAVWADPTVFKPERFVESLGGESVDVRGGDLRLAPFGAGRRVCPGKSLGLATVQLWVAKLVHHFQWSVDPAKPVDLSELLKLSCEMKAPLSAVAVSTGVAL